MHEDRKAGPIGGADCRGKKDWSAPALTRIAVSEAEVGTRDQVDGAFTAS